MVMVKVTDSCHFHKFNANTIRFKLGKSKRKQECIETKVYTFKHLHVFS